MVSSSSVNDTGAVTTRNLTLQRPIHSRSIGDRNRKGAKRGGEARRYAHRPVVKVRSPYAYEHCPSADRALPFTAWSCRWASRRRPRIMQTRPAVFALDRCGENFLGTIGTALSCFHGHILRCRSAELKHRSARETKGGRAYRRRATARASS